MDSTSSNEPCKAKGIRIRVIESLMYSRLSLSRIPRDTEILRDIRTSTYQICRIEEKTIRTTTFKYIGNWTLEARDILNILWKRGEIAPLFHNIFYPCC